LSWDNAKLLAKITEMRPTATRAPNAKIAREIVILKFMVQYPHGRWRSLTPLSAGNLPAFN
jgi:hypothetical protein